MTNPTRSQIEQALDGVPAGTKVTLKLEDGSETTGILSGTDADAVNLEDLGDVDLDQVAGVYLEGETEGPE